MPWLFQLLEAPGMLWLMASPEVASGMTSSSLPRTLALFPFVRVHGIALGPRGSSGIRSAAVLIPLSVSSDIPQVWPRDVDIFEGLVLCLPRMS